ncbi:MAG: hypothetical protein ACYCOU_22710 [Sulfobacillus sp.]
MLEKENGIDAILTKIKVKFSVFGPPSLVKGLLSFKPLLQAQLEDDWRDVGLGRIAEGTTNEVYYR